ncbi:MAG: ATP-binding cassette domain-containing protein [Geminicoccaceae bacterium]
MLAISDRVTVFRNSRKIATAEAKAVDKHWLIQGMIGQGHQELEDAIEGRVRLAAAEDAPVVLETAGLGRKGAFREVSFSVRAGEVLGLYGFMGSGQLELARSLMGKLVPDTGEVRVVGKPVRLTSTARAKAAGLALVPESRRAMLFADEPVFKNISISILERIGRVLLRPQEERRIAQGHVDRLRIRPYWSSRPCVPLGRQPAEGGAGALADAPAARPDPGRADARHGCGGQGGRGADRARAEGAGCRGDRGSAEPETVLALADRILVLRKGEIAREFKDETVSKDRLLAAA